MRGSGGSVADERLYEIKQRTEGVHPRLDVR